jgi:hypothetical protein
LPLGGAGSRNFLRASAGFKIGERSGRLRFLTHGHAQRRALILVVEENEDLSALDSLAVGCIDSDNATADGAADAG